MTATRVHATTGVILGDDYRDDLHGQVGKAVSVAEFLHGCARVCIEYVNADGDVCERYIDIGQLIHVRTGKRMRPRSAAPVEVAADADTAVAG